MKKILLSVLSLISLSGAAQSPGTLDSSFNGNGIVILAPGTQHDIVNDMTVLPDGYILIGGNTRVTATGYNNDITVGRLRPDGALDLTFGVNGWYKKDFNALSDHGYTLRVTPDKKILIAGGTLMTSTDAAFVVIRLNDDGSADSTFGNGLSYVIHNIDASEDYIQEIALQDDGKIVVAGTSKVPGFNYKRGVVARLESDGSLDTTFGVNGVSKIQLGSNTEDNFYAVELQPDGKIVAAGYDFTNLQSTVIAARFNADGSLDSGFAFNGVYKAPYGNNFKRVYDIELQWPNRIIFAGQGENGGGTDLLLIALDTSGMLDLSFGNIGSVFLDFGASESFLRMRKATDGKLIAAGGSGLQANLSNRFVVSSFSMDGIPDTTFGNNGSAIIDLVGAFEDANTMDIQPFDGKIVAGGFTAQTNNDMAIIRLHGAINTVDVPLRHPDEFLLFPNPLSGNELRIQLMRPSSSDSRVTLFNVMGKEVLTWEVQADYSASFTLDVPAVSPGTYYLRVINSGKVMTRPIIVR